MAPKVRSKLDEELLLLNEKLLFLLDSTITVFNNSKEALKDMNHSLALDIVRNDNEINGLDEEINDMAISIMALQAPVATDLRRIVTTLRISNHLERIADYGVNIAEYIIVVKSPVEELIPDVLKMIDCVVNMLEESKNVLSNPDKRAAQQIADMDIELDTLYYKSFKRMVKTIQNNIGDGEAASKMVLIMKYLERAGDHITNIAEEIAYLDRGRVYEFNKKTGIKHRLLDDEE
ncbi:MAG: phosphate signaling complex protein PhoU [Culicoidibacterales bacterium]